MRPPAAWVDRIASSLAFYPPFPASYRIKRQPDGRRELYVAPSRESRLPSCAFAEAALLPRDGGRKQVAAALIPAPSSSLPGSACSTEKRRVILFAHGNAVDLAQQLPFLRELSAALAKGGAPCAVACFDYQGYGESRRVSPAEKDEEDDERGRGGGERRNGGAGKSGASSCACDPPPSDADAAALPRQAPLCPDHGAAPDSTTADALLDGAAALAWLLEEKGFAPSEVVLYGQSLGSGVATSLAVALCGRERERLREEERRRRRQKKKGGGAAPTAAAGSAPPPSSGGLAAAGLILHSPLASGLRVLKPSWRFWPAALDIFPVARAAAKLSSPKGAGGAAGRMTKCLVIHGDADDVVPFDNGRAVFDALPAEARVEPLWVRGGGHCDLEGRAGFLPRLLKFLKDEI